MILLSFCPSRCSCFYLDDVFLFLQRACSSHATFHANHVNDYGECHCDDAVAIYYVISSCALMKLMIYDGDGHDHAIYFCFLSDDLILNESVMLRMKLRAMRGEMLRNVQC